MNGITFRNIYKQGKVVAENERYRHVHFSDFLLLYDGNFIEFKTIPSAEEFQKVAAYLRDYHLRNGQNHVKFYLPENVAPSSELVEYFQKAEYDSGFLELYGIRPHEFPRIEHNEDIRVQRVTKANFNQYLALQYDQDLAYGEAFANRKVDIHKENYSKDKVIQILAFYKGEPAGAVDAIVNDDTVEIDGLFTIELYRNKGIASRLQQFVMEQFKDKTVILVADGEDTPRDMYQKQNYSYLGFQYEVLKIYPN